MFFLSLFIFHPLCVIFIRIDLTHANIDTHYIFFEGKMKRVSIRKYDKQSFPKILDAIKTGKYTVKKPDGPKYIHKKRQYREVEIHL